MRQMIYQSKALIELCLKIIFVTFSDHIGLSYGQSKV